MATVCRLLPLSETRDVIPVVQIAAKQNDTVWPSKISILRAQPSDHFPNHRYFSHLFTLTDGYAKDFIYLIRLFRRSLAISSVPATCNGQSGRLCWIFCNEELNFKPAILRHAPFVTLRFKEVQELAAQLSIYPFPHLQSTDPYFEEMTCEQQNVVSPAASQDM